MLKTMLNIIDDSTGYPSEMNSSNDFCSARSVAEMTFTIRQDGTPADDVTGMSSVRKVIVLTFLISAAHLTHCSGLTHNLLQRKAGTP